MTSEQIAKVAHEINRAYCQSIGDYTHPFWEQAPEWQRTSAINGVNFHIANPFAFPSDSHDAWMAEKLRAGWKWGPRKDANEKEHPCLLPYSELPVEQRTKDYLFRQVVHSLREIA